MQLPQSRRSPGCWASCRSDSRRLTTPTEHARLDGHRVDRTVDEVPPPHNTPGCIDTSVPRVAGPRVDQTVDELSPSQTILDHIAPNVPLLLELVSIGQSLNYHHR